MTLEPPLKWAGGKRWLVPHLLPLWQAHQHRRLVEPFCGGLGMTLGLRPKHAHLNDINPHVINFYQWLQKGIHSDLSSATHNNKDVFYDNRTRFNELIEKKQHRSHESAVLFYYLNRTCYNGLCRFNRKGFFNVSFGRYKKINYKTTETFKKYIDQFRQWQFTVGDFHTIKLEASDFVYADPPYDVQFTKYAKQDFTWDDQIRLVEWLSTHSGPVILSNQATPRIIDLYRIYGFEMFVVDAPRRISRTGDRTPAQEVIAYRNLEFMPLSDERYKVLQS